MSNSTTVVALVSVAALGAANCARTGCAAKNRPTAESAGGTASPSSESSSPAAAWAQSPPSAWPQLVLTNQATFRGHSALEGASSFLIRNSKGVVVAATALHLLGAAGGVTPPIAVSELNSVLEEWRLFPRTEPESYALAERVAIGGPKVDDRDWLLLTVAKTPKLPAEPLGVRKEPVRVGEIVYLVGCSYQTPECRQDVFRGKVTKRFRGDFWRFDLDTPTEIPGFSGAPIIDARGVVVGVTTIAFRPKMDGEKFLESGGEDVGDLYEALERL